MIKKKICMLGAFAVGKTSLVQRYVNSIFSEKYQTTIGVKIDKKNITLSDKEFNLLLWDIHGEDDFQKVKSSYLIGAAGYFLVIDGTRASSVDVAEQLHRLAIETIGRKPFVVLINKSDITQMWDISDEAMQRMQTRGWDILNTSAKTGQNVEEAFALLTRKMQEDEA